MNIIILGLIAYKLFISKDEQTNIKIPHYMENSSYNFPKFSKRFDNMENLSER